MLVKFETRRLLKDKLMSIVCFSSVFITLFFLVTFFFTVIYLAKDVFYQTSINLEIKTWQYVEEYDDEGNEIQSNEVDTSATLDATLLDELPNPIVLAIEEEGLYPSDLLSTGASLILNRAVFAMGNMGNLGNMGNEVKSLTIEIPLQYYSQDYLNNPEKDHDLLSAEKAILDYWQETGRLQSNVNLSFLTSLDSKSPELAGIYGGLIGSILMLIIAFLISFPIGLGAAVYFSELAPKNNVTNYLLININNLAAVPSIIYGVLGLTIFIHFFGIPRATPLVGGMVLSLMIIPMIIASGLVALQSIPNSIDEAAYGVGATHIQAILHHKIPLALPGMLTGSIIGIARALGESAPLLMIGMLAFIANEPTSLTDPISALPTVIYLWSQQPEQFFQQKAAAAIVVLLLVLVLLNLLAILLRNKFQVRL